MGVGVCDTSNEDLFLTRALWQKMQEVDELYSFAFETSLRTQYLYSASGARDLAKFTTRNVFKPAPGAVLEVFTAFGGNAWRGSSGGRFVQYNDRVLEPVDSDGGIPVPGVGKLMISQTASC
jgi:hypothetical protein